MKISPSLRTRLISIVVVLGVAGALQAQEAGDTVIKQGTIKEDLYLAGGTIQLSANVVGDVYAAGGQIGVDNNVSGDVVAAGGNVTLRARIGDDARLAGGNVTVAGGVGDDLLAAGGRILVAPTATIGGRAWLAGHSVHIAGKVSKNVKAAGNRIVVTGELGGDANLIADTLEVQPGAIIRGNLTYYSREEPRIAKEAKILGTVTRAPGQESDPRAGLAGRLAGGVFYIGLILAGIVLYLLFPVASVGAAHTISESPWKSVGLGLAFLAATPLVIALLFATLFGVWLAIAALMLYLLLLFAGFLTGVIYVGELGLGLFGRPPETTSGWRVLALVVAFILLWAIRFIPVLGGVVVFALTLVGLGALVLYMARRYVGDV